MTQTYLSPQATTVVFTSREASVAERLRSSPLRGFGEVTVAVANDKKPRRQDSRVPAVYLASAFVWIIPVLEFCKISNLRRINPPEGFDSHPCFHLSSIGLNRLGR